MMRSLIARLKVWAGALDGIDDPLGAYLLALERRIRMLEDTRQDAPNPPRSP